MAQLTTIKRVATSTGSSKELVAAVSGKRIRVLSMIINRNGGSGVSVNLRSGGASGTRILYDIAIPDTNSVIFPFTDEGWFDTLVGENLFIQQSGTAGTISVTFSYQEID